MRVSLTFSFETRADFGKLDIFVRGLCENVMSGDQLDVLHGIEVSRGTYLNEMKSLSFAKVMTRLASSLGTGKSAPRIPFTRSPNLLPKPSKIRCGYCSDTVLSAFELTSCRSTTFDKVIDRVGP